MQTVNKLDYIYRKLVVKAREQRNETVNITDEEYDKYYLSEYKPNGDNTQYSYDLTGAWKANNVGPIRYMIITLYGESAIPATTEIYFENNPFEELQGTGELIEYYIETEDFGGRWWGDDMIIISQFEYNIIYDNINSPIIKINFISGIYNETITYIKDFKIQKNIFTAKLIRYDGICRDIEGTDINDYIDIFDDELLLSQNCLVNVEFTKCNHYININQNNNELIPELSRLEFPKIKDDGNNMIVIHRTSDNAINYSLEWDCNKKAPRWVCYQINHEGTFISSMAITNDWVEDPEIPSQLRFSDTQSMYMGSGYVRGHLVASADRLYSNEANNQVFYYSNIMPMLYNFNGGIWAQLENRIHSWNNSTFADTLYVVKGGTIDKEEQILDHIKPDVEGGLIVPKYFFATILCKKDQNYKAIGFWIEHRSDYEDEIDLTKYVVNIDQLEALTGIDFFCNLPDDIERIVESQSRETIINEWFGSN